MDVTAWTIISAMGAAIISMAAYIKHLHARLDDARKSHIEFAERARNLADKIKREGRSGENGEA